MRLTKRIGGLNKNINKTSISLLKSIKPFKSFSYLIDKKLVSQEYHNLVHHNKLELHNLKSSEWNLPQTEVFYELTTLKNGIKLVTEFTPLPSYNTLCFHFNFGSRNEESDNRGSTLIINEAFMIYLMK